MIRWNRLVVACAASFLVAACSGSGSSPTAPETEVRRNGGMVVGGNDVPPDSTTSVQTTSGDTLPGEATGENQRNGGLVVGGN